MEDQVMTARKQTKRTEIGAVRKAPTKGQKARPTIMPPGPKPTSTSAEASSRSKRALLIDRLSQPEGTRIDDLTRELGWLPHTVRAALTGLRRKGYLVAREKREGQASIYRATPPATEKQSTSPSVKRPDRASSRRAV
jgi:hypothetical protein